MVKKPLTDLSVTVWQQNKVRVTVPVNKVAAFHLALKWCCDLGLASGLSWIDFICSMQNSTVECNLMTCRSLGRRHEAEQPTLNQALFFASKELF